MKEFSKSYGWLSVAALFIALGSMPAGAAEESAIVGEVSARDIRMQTRTSWDYQPGQGPRYTKDRSYIRTVPSSKKPTTPYPTVKPGDWRDPPSAKDQVPVKIFSAEPKTETGADIGIQVSSFHYHEADDPAMKLSGPMFGIAGSYTNAFAPNWFGRVEGRIVAGNPEYNDPDTKNKHVPGYVGEIRATVGWDLLRGHFGLSPYAGIGYRYQQSEVYRFDQSQTAKFTRRGHYLFAPIGFEPRVTLLNGARLVMKAEFDPLLMGWQSSKLSNISEAWPDIHTQQKTGYGLRGEISYVAERWSVGPFVNYWNVNESKEDCKTGTGSGAISTCGIDPHNHTVEYGLNLRYRLP